MLPYEKRRGKKRSCLSKEAQKLPPPPSAVALEAILKDRRKVSLASIIRVFFHSTLLWRWKNGKARPDFDQAALLERITKGKIPIQGWVNPEGVLRLQRELNPRARMRNTNLRGLNFQGFIEGLFGKEDYRRGLELAKKYGWQL